jgi:hypothetical protein
VKLFPFLFLPVCGILSLRADVVPGVFGTGIATGGSLLAAGAVDPHWKLVASADAASPGPDVQVVNNGFPIPPWPAQGPDSQWIAPKADQSIGNPAGAYRYRTSFDLSGFDPASAELRIVLVSDNLTTGVVLNGVTTGLAFTNSVSVWDTKFLNSGFVSGVNTLEFIVQNDGGPTGFRCELLATATVVQEDFQPRAEQQGNSVVLSWPAILPCYKLETAESPGAQSWTLVDATPVLLEGRMTLTLPRDGAKRFYRLRRDEESPPLPKVTVRHGLDTPPEYQITEDARFGPENSCDIGAGCSMVFPIDGTLTKALDASACIDPRRCLEADPALSYQWQLRFPPLIRSGEVYTYNTGIQGWNTPVLTLPPSSLPALTGVDVQWRAILTITSSSGGVVKQTQALFRFQYDSSELSLGSLGN